MTRKPAVNLVGAQSGTIIATLVSKGFMRRISVCILAATSLMGQALRPVAFTNAVIIDGNGGPPVEHGVLVMRGEKVEAVGAAGSVQIPAYAEVRDLKGKALMPGLADMHVHLNGGWDGESVDMLGYQRYLNALLYAGVTTVFDAGNTLPYIIQLRDEVAAGRLIGPRIYCAGPLLDGADPAWRPISYSVTSVDQIPGIVKELKESRVDAIKVYAGLSDRLVGALAREARTNSLPLLIDQAWRNGSIEMVMGDGVTMFAHLPDAPIGMFYGTETVKIMKARGVKFTSTLSVVESFSRRRLENLAFLDSPLIRDTMPASFLAGLRAATPRYLQGRGRPQNLERLKQRSANTKILYDAGLLIAAGTDAAYPGVFHGEGLHHELELLVEAGLTPLAAISSATHNAAQFIGAEKEWGTLEPGRRADLLVIHGRPDQRIQDTRNIVAVIQRGQTLDRTKLKLNPAADPGFLPTVAIKTEGGR
jgi:imidazolonepropionase-like amidohydrolase